QQSAFNRHVLAALQELAECYTALDRPSGDAGPAGQIEALREQLAASQARCAGLEQRVRETEGLGVGEGGEWRTDEQYHVVFVGSVPPWWGRVRVGGIRLSGTPHPDPPPPRGEGEIQGRWQRGITSSVVSVSASLFSRDRQCPAGPCDAGAVAARSTAVRR